jgi:RNA polymerase sigma factor (sigma-70 family)
MVMEVVTERAALPGLVATAAAGDEVAFARIVAAYDDDLCRVAYVIAGDVATAHEAVQAAWSQAWRGLKRLRDPERLRPWLASIAANEARQLVRRQRLRTVREIPLDSALSSPNGTFAAPDRDRELDLMAAVRSLRADDRSLIAMRFVLDLSSTEIARELGMSPSGVRSRLAKVLGELRRGLGDD